MLHKTLYPYKNTWNMQTNSADKKTRHQRKWNENLEEAKGPPVLRTEGRRCGDVSALHRDLRLHPVPVEIPRWSQGRRKPRTPVGRANRGPRRQEGLTVIGVTLCTCVTLASPHTQTHARRNGGPSRPAAAGGSLARGSGVSALGEER